MGICLPVQRNFETESDVDEVVIPDTEFGYPEPVPPDPLHGSLARTQHCFTNERFNNATDDVDLFKKFFVDTDDISLDLNTMSEEYIDDAYQSRPHTNESRKSSSKRSRPQTAASMKFELSFHAIDDHAKKADKQLLNSFEKLFKYLMEPLTSDIFRKTKTARAIVVWLSQQKLEQNSYGKRNTDAPRGLLQYVKEGKMSYATCYAILCRKAGLQCAIVRGHVKAAGYEPGDEELPVGSWNAVYVESGWQIIHALWICRAVFGHNTGGWIKVEQDGKTMSKKEKASAGIEQNTFQEQFFMPNPEEFIYHCCASKAEWQLVSPHSVVSTKEEFVNKAFQHLPFFDIGFKLTSEPRCYLESKNGFCKIELKAKPANAHMIVLKYELFKKELDDDSNKTSKTDEEVDIARMVFNSRAGETFIFDIRFPKTGIYKLVINGGPHKSASLRLCEFKLVCNQEMVDRNLLPLDCGKIGWGPGPVAVEAGLLMPSKPSGLIPVNEKEKKTDVKFQVRDMNESYTAVVHGEVGGRRKQLDDTAVDVQKNEQSRQLVVSVTIPDKGEYGLSIQHLTGQKLNNEWENVCHYLVSTLAYTPERANVKNAKQKLKEVTEAPVEPQRLKERIKDIQFCIQRCKKEKVQDSDYEIINANEMVLFLICKDKLRDCALRRNLHVIRRTLQIVSLYKNRDALTVEIEKVKGIEDEIVALNGFARQVPKLEEANKEIVALKNAPDEVHNTLKALLVLLGESEYYLEDWATIQSRMKASTHTNETYVLGMMKRIQKQEIDQDRLQRALEILHEYDEKQVRTVNSDAHSFYLWIENIINVHEGN
ncbi:lim and transglutaminase domain protein ltd-1-like [Mercenaria mercenaria]|uniref:lim and transglutaminase domain protein ltd-1-like n=1 Tax=Mercenaria mercenaria TaxID=6596 RepID=UPI00234E6C72|nr:lim and transglutaminase domain protein ltd-1-like [Mercenaria mercenaria]XP_053384824.1 lim and transglutaminase domain protein ltd-1-like [Mercenaria mercenaria]